MFIDYFFSALSKLLSFLEIAIIARAILSWLPMGRYGTIVKIIHQITEPILAPIRRMLERSSFARNMMIDISPIVAFFLISAVRTIGLRLLYTLVTGF